MGDHEQSVILEEVTSVHGYIIQKSLYNIIIPYNNTLNEYILNDIQFYIFPIYTLCEKCIWLVRDHNV